MTNYSNWKGQSKYRIEGKIETPLEPEDFKEGMEHGKFVQKLHRAYCVLLYYSAVRKNEGRLVLGDQFQITRKAIMYDVGERFKHSAKTASLKLPLKAPYMTELKEAIENTRKGERVFPFSAKTAYNIVRRAFKYPHLFRLSRITQFFLAKWSIAEVRSWTGLSVAALDYYVGLVSVSRMGDSMANEAVSKTG